MTEAVFTNTQDPRHKTARLRDDRAFRLLIDRQGAFGKHGQNVFKQALVFRLRADGILPLHERSMNAEEISQVIILGLAEQVRANNLWRTNRYWVYKRGIERETSWFSRGVLTSTQLEEAEIGAKIILMENGIPFVMEIPDVKHQIYTNLGLRQAREVLDFDSDKLQYDEGTRTVSVTTDFNPETDVRAIDVMRPRAYARADENSYPMRIRPAKSEIEEAVFAWIKHDNEFEQGSTGWHGSLGHLIGNDSWNRMLFAQAQWSEPSGIIAVERDAPMQGKDIAVTLTVPGISEEELRRMLTQLPGNMDRLRRILEITYREPFEKLATILQGAQIHGSGKKSE